MAVRDPEYYEYDLEAWPEIASVTSTRPSELGQV